MTKIIRADYDALLLLLKRVADQAELIDFMNQAICRQLAILETEWTGEGAYSFYYEMDDLVLPAVHQLQLALQETNQVFLYIVMHFQQAEHEAALLIMLDEIGPDALGRMFSIHQAFLSGAFAGLWQLLGNSANREVISNILQQIGSGNVLSMLDYLAENRPFGKFLNLIGDLTNAKNLDLLGNPAWLKKLSSIPFLGTVLMSFELLTRIQEGGLNVENLSESLTAISIKTLIEKNPYGAAAMLINSSFQFGGEAQFATYGFMRDLITGGDPNAAGYYTMTQGLDNFRGILHRADLENVINSFSSLASDVIFEPFFEPLLNSIEVYRNDPSTQNGHELMDSIQRRSGLLSFGAVSMPLYGMNLGRNLEEAVSSVDSFFRNPSHDNFAIVIQQTGDVIPYIGGHISIAGEFVGNPEQAREAIGSAFNFVGSVVDTTLSIGMLSLAQQNLNDSMVLGIQENIVNRLPISQIAKDSLSHFAITTPLAVNPIGAYLSRGVTSELVDFYSNDFKIGDAISDFGKKLVGKE